MIEEGLREGLNLVAVSELHEAEDNPRRISPEALERLKRNITAAPAMLEARPLIADLGAGGEIIAGNMRLRAVRELGWELVPVYGKHFADPSERREWALRDNSDSFGEWVPEELAAILALQRDEGRDLELLGFSMPEAEAYLSLLSEPAPERPPREPDEAPPAPAEPITRDGDRWLLGRHVLLCGDAGDEETLEELVGDSIEFVQAVLTDPPYGIELDTDFSSMEGFGRGHVYEPIIGDDLPSILEVIPAVVAYFADVPEHFYFGADYYSTLLLESWDVIGSWLVWDKRTETSDAGFGSGFELVASRAKHQRRILRHLWFGMFGGEEARHRLHPTQKPTALLREILETWVLEEGAIVDPFAGSGSTLIACEQIGRPCWAVEIEPRYCDVIVARWEEFTGEKAIRA